ncbi:serine hydrolase-like protein 2 isoform X4 [Pezoporus occidentalis]|uniref:serine hydrolase-like protein 2 isoform X4 n=1 Tax=Pezoporus occidentalis TaxID=407982 RepID=UPI002F90E881
MVTPGSQPMVVRIRPAKELWAINKIPGTYSEQVALSRDIPCEHSILGMFSEVKFPVPWGHVAAKAWGSAEGHPVLCLHGWLDNANTFDKLIPLLPRDCYYVAMDFSGHGLSSHRPAGCPYHFLDYVSDVRRVAAALQWRRFTLMGHSMGGAVAGMFCFLYPEMVDKLILLENLGFLLAPEDTEAWLESKRLVIDRLLSLEAKQQTPRARSPEAALQRAQDGLLVPYKLDTRNHFVKDLRKAFESTLKEHIQLIEVPGSHFVHLNKPEVVSGIISNFLTAQNTRARL